MQKRKAFAFLLALAMIFCLLQTAAFAAPFSFMPVNSYERLQELINKAPTDGTEFRIRLTADITEMKQYVGIGEDRNIVLDLNGYKLDRGLETATENGQVIRVFKDASLTVIDTGVGQCGLITGGNALTGAGGVEVNEGATFTLKSGNIAGNTGFNGGVCVLGGTFDMYGGTVCGNKAAKGAGVAVMDGGTFNLYDGEICDNNAVVDCNNHEDGGGVYVHGVEETSIFNMYGGKITRNTVLQGGGGVYTACGDNGTFNFYDGEITENIAGKSGGGIYVYCGTLNISGGLISGNRATGEADDMATGIGGGIRIDRSEKVSILGGTITDNWAANFGGGVSCNYPITVGGKVQVTGNTSGEEGKEIASNLYLRLNAKSVYFDGKSPITNDDDSPLTAEARIGISTDVAGWADLGTSFQKPEINPESFFFADDGDTAVVYNDLFGQLSLTEVTEVDSVEKLLETAKKSAAEKKKAAVRLIKDITLKEPLVIDGKTSLLIDLNGFDLDRGLTDEDPAENGNVITVEGRLAIVDSSEEQDGRVTGGNVSKWGVGGGISVLNGAKLSLFSGHICGNKSIVGGGVYLDDGATFHLYGGEICDNTVENTIGKSSDGGGVYVCGNKAESVFKMFGGAITRNSAEQGGGGVFVGAGKQGYFYFLGGEITENTAGKSGAGVYVYCGSLEMTGGLISENEAIGTVEDDSKGFGGGILVDDNATAKILGGKITGNRSKVAAGGIACNNPITVGGKVQVFGNTSGEEGEEFASNLFLRLAKKSAFFSGRKAISVSMEAPLTAGAKIGFSTDDEGKTRELIETYSDVTDYFFPDDGESELFWDSVNGVMIRETGEAIVVETKNPEEIGKVLEEAGKAQKTFLIKLTDDVKLTDTLVIPAGARVILDLNGCTLDRGVTEAGFGGNVITNNGTLIVRDSSEIGTGKITGGNTFGNGGGVCNTGRFTLESGTICENKAENGGGVANALSGKFIMLGGTICHNVSFENGGGLYNQSEAVITGGEITRNTTTEYEIHVGFTATANGDRWSGLGGGVYNAGTLTLGGTPVIWNNTAVQKEYDNLYLAISDFMSDSQLFFGDPQTNNVPSLAFGAKIGVTVSEPLDAIYDSVVFSENGTPADVLCFDADTENQAILLRDGKLYMVYTDCGYWINTVPYELETLKLTIGREELYVQAEETENGWKLMRTSKPGLEGELPPDSKYLSVDADGKLTYTSQDKAAEWVYHNGSFSITKTVQTKTTGFWFLFWYVPSRQIVSNVTYYLSSAKEGTALNTRYTAVQLQEEKFSAEHHLVPDGFSEDGKPLHVCTICGQKGECAFLHDDNTHCICGRYNTEKSTVDVEVTRNSTTVYGWFWTRYKVYSATISAVSGTGLPVKSVMYSTDNKNWHRGTTFTSNVEISKFWIRVVDSHGVTHNYVFDASYSKVNAKEITD